MIDEIDFVVIILFSTKMMKLMKVESEGRNLKQNLVLTHGHCLFTTWLKLVLLSTFCLYGLTTKSVLQAFNSDQ